jgi:hypothetical protein
VDLDDRKGPVETRQVELRDVEHEAAEEPLDFVGF